MKKIIYLFVLVVFMFACNKVPHYTIKGKIVGADSITFILQQRAAGNRVVTIDSVFSKNGSFKMTGTVEYPDMVQLVAREPGHGISFFIENSPISITGKLDSLYNAIITGSKTQDEYQAYRDTNEALRGKYSAFYRDYQVARQENDTAKISGLEKEIVAAQNQMTQLKKDYIKDNPSSYVAPLLLSSLSYDLEAEEIEAAIYAMDTNVAKIPIVNELKARIVLMKAVSIGHKAPDFTLNDVNGNSVPLYSKVGSRLLLIDFWAAWCAPCRQENPNVVRIYNQFHKKGFDVFGVSLDEKKDDWVKAIADDKLTWTHVSDLKYWNNAAAKMYAVEAIPANFLLDETGTIIARNLRGQALSDKVKGILESK